MFGGELQQNSPTSSPYLFPASHRPRLRDFLSYSLVAWKFCFVLLGFFWLGFFFFFHCSPYVCLLWTCLIAFEQVSRRWLESGMVEMGFMGKKRWEKSLSKFSKRGGASDVPKQLLSVCSLGRTDNK